MGEPGHHSRTGPLCITGIDRQFRGDQLDEGSKIRVDIPGRELLGFGDELPGGIDLAACADQAGHGSVAVDGADAAALPTDTVVAQYPGFRPSPGAVQRVDRGRQEMRAEPSLEPV